jgi:hypothetical protein
MQDEAVLVFHDADPQTQFDRHAGFAFADPFRVRLEYRKDLLGMRNGFSQNDAPPGLVNLPYGMCDELFDLELAARCSTPPAPLHAGVLLSVSWALSR